MLLGRGVGKMEPAAPGASMRRSRIIGKGASEGEALNVQRPLSTRGASSCESPRLNVTNNQTLVLNARG